MVRDMDVLTGPERSTVVEPDRGVGGAVRLRAYAAVALGPLFVGYGAVVALLALITAVTPHAALSWTGVLAVGGPAWLAAYQVPLGIAGAPLGVLPLVPTVAVCLLVGRAACAATRRLRHTELSQGAAIVGVVAGAHAVAGIPISAFADGDGPVGPVVEPLSASLVPAMVAGVSAAVGVVRNAGFSRVLRAHLDPLALRGLRAGALALAGLCGAAALTYAVATAAAMPTVGDLFRTTAPDAGSAAGVFLLSLGYLPNVIVLTLGFVSGPGFGVGALSVSPFSFSGGSLPALPVLAAVPGHPQPWWPAFLLLPAVVGAMVGWSLRNVDVRPLARLRTVAVAAVVAAFAAVVLGAVAGGRLGEGALNPVSYPLGPVSVAVFCWIAVPGGFVAWYAGPRRRRTSRGAEREKLPDTGDRTPSVVGIEVSDGDVAGGEEPTPDAPDAKEADTPAERAQGAADTDDADADGAAGRA